MAVTLLDPVQTQETTTHLSAPPPLMAGDRLTRVEFERRYRHQPTTKKAELIEGVVYMPSPVTFGRHANPHHSLVTWTGLYVAATPGVEGGDNATVRLDNNNEVQPDILLRIDPAVGGRSRIDGDDFIAGAPELIVEIAATSANYDMHDKKHIYARNGVAEYLVALTHEQAVHWFVLREGEYVALAPGEDGMLRSEAFPGLWLDAAALWRHDLATLLAVLQSGLASAGHAAFVAQLRSGLIGAT